MFRFSFWYCVRNIADFIKFLSARTKDVTNLVGSTGSLCTCRVEVVADYITFTM